MMEEKRKFPRYSYPFEVEYSPKGEGVIYSRTVTKNISKGGMCIPVLSRLVRTGDSILIEIYPNGNRKKFISVRGKVVWTKEAADLLSSLSTDTEAGIEFNEFDSSEIDGLMKTATR